MGKTWTFQTAGQLTFGPGAAAQLGDICRRRQLQRTLVMTDKVLRSLGLLERVVEPLDAAGITCEVFDGGEPEPSIEAVLRARNQAKQFRPDALIGFGGGSNMDLTKLAAVLVTHGGKPDDYFGFDRVPGPVLPLICVPTTAGTGSEVSHAAVVTDSANHIKVSTLSNYLRPAVALVDPEFTYGCPKQVTADSGIDALTHAIEAYTATDFDKIEFPSGAAGGYEGRFLLGTSVAEQAISLIGKHLVTAVHEPANRDARDGMALAATLAGIAFSNCGVALVHGLEYPLGAAVHCSHGAGNGLLLPHVMRFNLPTRMAAFARIARLLGEDIAGLSEAAAAERAIAAVDRIREAIGVPGRIRDLGGREDQLPGFADRAFQIKRLLAVNPRPATRDDLLAIYRAAF
jgi:alcohol dehydrogenase class IV